MKSPIPFVSVSLGRVTWRYLLRHPWQTILMVVGIMLGVSVVVAVDLANESASRAFDLSVDAVAGQTTHQIVGGVTGIDESYYTELYHSIPETIFIAPVVSETVTSPALGDRPLTLLGVDVFSEPPFRNYLSGSDDTSIPDLTTFLTTPGAVLMASDTASQYGLEVGDIISLEIGGYTQDVVLVGVLAPDDALTARMVSNLLIADIATAQELTGRTDTLDRIDLLIPEGNGEAVELISASLPPEVTVAEVSARSGAVRQMTAAFRTNLLALSLLALVVGMFLIYNTITFSVVQRRSLLGTLRCIGVTQREVFMLIMTEALVVGLLGSGLGVLLGIALGQGAVRLVTRTVNDLFFAVSVQGLQVPPISLIKGMAIGMAATLATAAPPAWEAANVPPRAALSRANIETKARSVVRWVALSGLLMVVLGFAILLISAEALAISFGGTFAVVVGITMMTPQIMTLLLKLITLIADKARGTLGRIALRSVSGSLSRTSIAVAALMVASSVTIGISVMVGSFRHTVQIWLEQTLQGDVYIALPDGTAATPSSPVDARLIPILNNWPDVKRVDTVRATTVESIYGPVPLLAVNNPTSGEARLYLSQAGSTPDETWQLVEEGAVLISEPFARRHDLLDSDSTVTLYTPQGTVTFDIAGIYYDYGSVQGQVMLADQVYRNLWDDETVTAIALHLEKGTPVDDIVSDLQQELVRIQQVDVQANRALRNEVLKIFDQTFAITGALNVLATIVAFIGILSALLSLQLEKQRELGILRALGLTIRQLWGVTMIETGVLGSLAGMLSWPTGYILSLILVYIINRRSFGWTLQMKVEPGPFIMAFGVAVIASLLAGVYPAYRLSRVVTADAIRFDDVE